MTDSSARGTASSVRSAPGEDPRGGHAPDSATAHVTDLCSLTGDVHVLLGLVDATLIEERVGERGGQVRHAAAVADLLHESSEARNSRSAATGSPAWSSSGPVEKPSERERHLVAVLTEDRARLLQQLSALVEPALECNQRSHDPQGPAL